MKTVKIMATGKFNSKEGYWIKVSYPEGRFVVTSFVEVTELLDTDVEGADIEIPSKLLK
jgi:hypothetical protein